MYCINRLATTIVLFSLFLLTTTACGDDDCCITPEENCMDKPCVEEILPIVFMHGFLGSGDTYSLQIQRFLANGYPKDHLYTYDWNSLVPANAVRDLDILIDDIIAKTGKPQVNLVGHSAGGGQGYNYLSDTLERAPKVKYYVHIASNPNGALPGSKAQPTQTLNIYSTDDRVVTGADIPGAENLSQAAQDHYQIATNYESFSAMYAFFNEGILPKQNEIPTAQNNEAAGKVLTFGENQAATGATLDIYEVDAASGVRVGTAPLFSFAIDDSGSWGPAQLSLERLYEFHITKANDPNFRPIHYYREAISYDNPNVYLRVFPPEGSIANFILGGIPKDDNQSVTVIFQSSQAVISGRDELMIDGLELSTESLASEDQTAIAFFIYDNNSDSVSSLEKLPAFAMFPFLNGIDYYISTDSTQSISTVFNGRMINLPNWKSDTEGVSVVVFD